MEQLGIVLAASQYSFEDAKTKKMIEGCNIHYILAENLAPFTEKEGSKGYKPIKETLPMAAYDTIGELPGLYNLKLGFKPDPKGGLKAVVVGLEFVSLLGNSRL